MKDKLIYFFIIIIMGILGSTARYIHNLGVKEHAFSMKAWCVSCFLGCTVAIITGLIANHYNLSTELTFAIVGLSAIASKEIIEFTPGVLEKWLAGRVK